MLTTYSMAKWLRVGVRAFAMSVFTTQAVDPSGQEVTQVLECYAICRLAKLPQESWRRVWAQIKASAGR